MLEHLINERLFQESVKGVLRVASNDKPFLFGTTLALFLLPLWFFRHHALVSHKFWLGADVVPQPGFGPGRPEWSHGCKPCAYTSSATGARKLQDVGTQGTFAGFGVPTFFGPSSAALNPSSWQFSPISLRHDSEQVCGDLTGFGESRIRQSIGLASMFPDDDYVPVTGQLFEQTVHATYGKSTCGCVSCHHFSTRDGVVLSKNLLPVQQQQHCIVNVSWACGQRDSAFVHSHDSVECRICFWRCQFASRRSGTLFVIGIHHDIGGQRANQVHKSLHLFLHDSDGSFRLKFMSSDFQSHAVVVVHFFTPLTVPNYMEATCACQA